MKTKLIINTANDELILSLYTKDKVFYKINSSKMHHNETMLPLIDELLRENGLKIQDIKEFGVIVGPGSFTGIRVGIATVKAFRDAINAEAKGINNLDYLFRLCNKQNKEIETVAIAGSYNSYFVAKLINSEIYKYPRNVTLDELKDIANNKPIGMFKNDENLNCFVPEFDAEVLLECYNLSNNINLTPVYYQLSQAESEKLKRGDLLIECAGAEDFMSIKTLEQENISANALTDSDIVEALSGKTYKTFKAVHENKIVGFVITQITDEVNIASVAVDKAYRNIGVATKLLKHVENFTKEHCLSVVSLEVSYKNITAYLLYQKLGFKVRRLRKKYYSDGTDALEMFKEI